ncbi:MAG: hypothetical protein JXA10_13310 [Anaerolineae bacterium]|nr:hypothetical protein [Anaerolineae bacterium]
MNPNEMVYTGESMRGTLRPGDRLVFAPVTLADLQPGDVVVYRKLGRNDQPNSNVVHRVLAITPGGAILRGDNNAPADVEWILPDYIIGRVTHFVRDHQTYTLRGGLAGLLVVRVMRRLRRLPVLIWQRIRAVVRPLIQAPYRLLRQSRVVGLVWKPTITQVTFQTADGPLVKYVHQGRTVVEWWPERNRYRSVRPYDLIIFPPDATVFSPELTRIDDP